jgi:hypothetical protein
MFNFLITSEVGILLEFIIFLLTLEAMINTCPVHYGIGDMAGLYFTVYRYGQISYGAEPNIMITLSMTFEVTAVFRQFLPDFLLVFGHYVNTAA